MKTIENRKSIGGIGTKKKLFPISIIIAILFLTPAFVIMASAQSKKLTFNIVSATADLKGKGDCFYATTGEIEAKLFPTFDEWTDERKVGAVSWDATYRYDFTDATLLPLRLIEAIEVHIHIDGSFRRMIEGSTEDITQLIIAGCTEEPTDGVQYCVHAMAFYENGYIGEVKRTGANEWSITANFLASDQGSPSLCGHEWVGSQPKEGFCIPLHDFEVEISGTVTG